MRTRTTKISPRLDADERALALAQARSQYGVEGFTVDEIGFLQVAAIKVLAAAARGEIDLNKIARRELACRGLDWNGRWVGFERAAEISKLFPIRDGRGKVIAVSVPEK